MPAALLKWERLSRRLLLLTWQDALQYRAESLVWFLYDLLPPLTMVLLWLAAYRGTSTIAGYGAQAMVSYYLGVIALRTLLNPHPEWDMADSIAKGEINQLLLKPLPIAWYRFLNELSWKVGRLFWLVPSLTLAALALRSYLVWPSLTPLHLLGLIVSLCFAYCVAFFVKMCMGLSAFWTTNSEGLFSLVFMIEFLFGGNIVPLQALPLALQRIADWLPFKYYFFFSLQVYLGKMTSEGLLRGLLIEAAWIALGFTAMRLLWRSGLRRYSAFGG